MLGKVLKSSIPFLRNYILPEVGGFVKNMTSDVTNNVPIRNSVRRNLISSAQNIGKRIVRGAGRVTKSKRVKKRKKKSQKKSC